MKKSKKNLIKKKDMEKEIKKYTKEFEKIAAKINKQQQRAKGRYAAIPDGLRFEYLEKSFKLIAIEDLYNKYFDNEEE